MLLSLSSRCNGGCLNCLRNSTMEDGEVMTLPTLENTMRFINYLEPIGLIITGGDIFLMNDFDKYLMVIMKALQNRKTKVIIESNGWWIVDAQIKERVKTLLASPKIMGIQIVIDKRFNPNYDVIMSHADELKSFHPKLNFIHDNEVEEGEIVDKIYHLGRAEALSNISTDILPSCEHLLTWGRSYDRIPSDKVSTKGLKKVLECLEYRGHLRTPYIWVNGDIKIGESPECQSLGNVDLIDENNGMRYYEWLMLDKLKYTLKYCEDCIDCKNVDPERRALLKL